MICPPPKPPAGAGFQSNSIIDGSQCLPPHHTLSPQPFPLQVRRCQETGWANDSQAAVGS